MDPVVAGLSVEHRGCPLSEIVALQFPVITPLPLFQQPVAIQSQLPHLPSSPSSLTVSLGGSQPKCCLSEALSTFQRELTVQIGSSPMQTQVAAQLCALQTTSYSPCSRAAWARLLEIQQVDASATCESLHYDFRCALIRPTARCHCLPEFSQWISHSKNMISPACGDISAWSHSSPEQPSPCCALITCGFDPLATLPSRHCLLLRASHLCRRRNLPTEYSSPTSATFHRSDRHLLAVNPSCQHSPKWVSMGTC